VHYKFDPKSTIPHLVVINGIKDNTLYYNDPAAKTGEKQISVTDFLRGWKQRFIVLRPLNTDGGAVVAISLN
jgi:ABC-type bacteriocin/lantibiotic exporter with double-glycine peptidase domain